MHSSDLLLENLIEISDKCPRRLLVIITNLFKSEFDGQVNLRVFVHRHDVDIEDRFAKLHQLDNKVFNLHLVVTD